MFRLGDLPEDVGTDEQFDVTEAFLKEARDWGEISDSVVDNGAMSVRKAKRSLSDALEMLSEHGAGTTSTQEP